MQGYQGHLPSGLKHFISISSKSEALLQPYLPSSARVHRVPNPVAVAQKIKASPGQHRTFSFVGRLSPEKGPRLLAECSTRHNLPVRFVGEGTEREALAAIAPNAEFTGWLPALAALDTMRRSRALVLPSLWYETQGLVVAEAAAMGLPAIVPSESAAREWVEDGTTGLVFRHGDASDLGQKMMLLDQHPKVAESMGHTAFLHYWDRPSTIDSHCEQLEAVYAEMLRHHRLYDLFGD